MNTGKIRLKTVEMLKFGEISSQNRLLKRKKIALNVSRPVFSIQSEHP